jgi:hypothetical protein
VLKKQVMGPKEGQSYADYAVQTVKGLRMMRKFGIR